MVWRTGLCRQMVLRLGSGGRRRAAFSVRLRSDRTKIGAQEKKEDPFAWPDRRTKRAESAEWNAVRRVRACKNVSWPPSVSG